MFGVKLSTCDLICFNDVDLHATQLSTSTKTQLTLKKPDSKN